MSSAANPVCWFEIPVRDMPRATRFYEAVFGWTFEDWGPPDFYLIRGAGVPGAIQARHEPVVSTHPRSFEITIGVDDIDDIIKRVTAAGGAIVMQKTHLDGVGTLIHFTDTEGNRVGAMKYDSEEA